MKRQQGLTETVQLKHIYLTETNIGTRIDYDYTLPESMIPYIKRDYIERNEGLFVEIPEGANAIPEAILVIPFVGIMLTVTSLLGIQIEVPVIEKSFYSSLNDLAKAYNTMFPGGRVEISVLAKEIKEIDYEVMDSRTGLLFTGGVDATAALAVTKEKHPLLINIWGGDIRLTDQDSHANLEEYLSYLTGEIQERFCFVRTNCREMFEENELGVKCEMLGHKNNHGWWASIAHILSMTTAIAPLAYLKRLGVVYVGSSWDGATTDSNNELFVNAVRYGQTKYEIVDEYVDRNEKIRKIITFREKYSIALELKVCWKRIAGNNCCRCEKCYRTIMGIMSNHDDPNNYGFIVNETTLQCIREYLMNNIVNTGFWRPIIESFKKDAMYWEKDEMMSWILHIRLNTPLIYFKKFAKRTIIRIRTRIVELEKVRINGSNFKENSRY